MIRIGLADTMFAQIDMGSVARNRLKAKGNDGLELISVTVPGFKDLAVAAKRLIEEDGCSVVLAMGWSGGAELDGRSAQIASMGLMHAQLATNRHILEVFVHVDEAPDDPAQLRAITIDRVKAHADNAYDIVFQPSALRRLAGTGRRQGGPDVGSI